MKNTGDVLTIDDLAIYLKISKSTLYKVAREGKIPSQKVGRHWRFRKAAIDRWLDDLPAEEALLKTPTKPARLSSRKERR